MIKVIGKSVEYEVSSLDDAMFLAKKMNEFVTIKSADYEIVGMFGVDTVANGKCPDGIAYDWDKDSRIGMARSS